MKWIKFISFLLVAVLLAGLFPFSAFAADTLLINDAERIALEQELADYAAEGYTVYRAEDGYTAKGATLSFQEADAYYMAYNSVYDGFKKISDGISDGYTATHTVSASGVLIPTYSGTVYYGATSGVKFVSGKESSAIAVMTPWQIVEGESFVFAANATVEDWVNTSRWLSLTFGNHISNDQIPQHYTLVTKVNGTSAGLSKAYEKNGAAVWDNYKHNNNAQTPIDAMPAMVKGETYTLLGVGKATVNAANEPIYQISFYVDGLTVMENYELPASEVVGGYLGLELNGMTVEFDYDDTAAAPDLEAYEKMGYELHIADEAYDYKSDMQLYAIQNGEALAVEGNEGIQYGLTGFRFNNPYSSGAQLVFKDWKLKAGADAVYSVDLTLDSFNSNSVYLGLGLGMELSEDGSKLNAFYHTNMRMYGYNAGFSRWEGGWQNIITTDRTGLIPLTAGKTYTFTVVVTDGHILSYYIDNVAIVRDFDVQVLQNWSHSSITFPAELAGYLGLTMTGVSVRAAYTVPEGQYEQALYKVNNGVAGDATVIWDSNSEVTPTEQMPPHEYGVVIDSEMQVYTTDGELLAVSLAELCDTLYKGNSIPLVYVKDPATAEALVRYVTAWGLSDLMAVSSDLAVLKCVTQKTGGIRGVYDLSAHAKSYTKAELAELMFRANASDVKVLLLNEKAADPVSVRWLQTRMMTVWARCGDDSNSPYTLLTSGVDGIVAKDYLAVYRAMEKFEGTNVLLRVPTVCGHRGSIVGADGSAIPEVTVDSLMQAAAFGADAVECDVYSTSDGVLVLQHGVDTSTMMIGADGTEKSYDIGKTPYQTLYDELVYRPEYSKDASGNFVERRINTLEEQFAAFAENEEIVFYLEFKNASSTIKVNERTDDEGNVYYQYAADGAISMPLDEYNVHELRRLAKKYEIEDQCLVISFDSGFLAAMHTIYPELSQGLLNSREYNDSLSSLVTYVEPTNACFDPRVIPSDATLSGLYARGITVHPWTKNGTTLDRCFVMGTLQSISTDNTVKIGNWAESITLRSTQIDVRLGESFELGATVSDHLGHAMEAPAFEVVALSGKGLTREADGRYTLTDSETVVMLKYVAQTDTGVTYTLYSNPITVTQGVAGDLDGDRVLTSADVVRLLQVLNGNKTVDLRLADLNGDGSISMADALRLLKWINA